MNYIISQPHTFVNLKDSNNVLYEDAYDVWCIENYMKNRTPIKIREFSIDSTLIKNETDIRMMLISKPNMNYCIYPNEFLFLKDIIEYCISYQNKIGFFMETYVYLTFNISSLDKGVYQRTPGTHYYGFQLYSHNRTKPTLSYSWTDNLPTVFYPNASINFNNVDISTKDLLNKYLCNIEKGLPLVSKVNTLYLWDSYTLHEAQKNIYESNLKRVFFRLTFAHSLFAKAGSSRKEVSINPFINFYE